MAFQRLPETVSILYSELLDQLAGAEPIAEAGAAGSLVSKQIRGRTYWYFQSIENGEKRQAYLGAETPELAAEIANAKESRAATSSDIRRRRDLVAMLIAGGALREPAPFARVIDVLNAAFVFRLGGVLVGTQAFTCYANMLGVRFEAQSLRTADIDVAQDANVSVGIGRLGSVDIAEKLKSADANFFPVPDLHPGAASTSFKVRGRDLRVDFVTAGSQSARSPVPLPHLGIAAQPLYGLEYIIERTTRAAVLSAGGLLVNVPLPARFALHKLWVARNRPVSEQAKSRKDVQQARQLLEVLREDRPADIDAAIKALKSRARMWKAVAPELERTL